MTVRNLSLAATAAAILTTVGSAQQPEGTQLSATNAQARELIRSSHATVAAGAHIDGYGHAYKASFRPGRMEFLPALGKEAPRNFPLSFTLESVRRGGTLVHQAQDDVVPTSDGDLVTFARGGSIEERYEVSAEGIHQSFLFDSPPAGTGDLVVRGRLNTELVPEATTDGGLVFRYSDLGGIRFGAVTGIDADGNSAPGKLRSDGFVLELVLPGDFVDAAAYPLLLDPLIGAEIAVEDSPAIDTSPEVSRGGGGLGRYLVVWERTISALHAEVYGQRLDSSGGLYGPLIPISTGNGIFARQPAAGYVSAEGNWLVAYTYSPNFLVVPQVRCRNIPLSSSDPLFPSVAVAAGSSQSSPDVGGDRTSTDNEAFVVWEENDVGVRGRTVTATQDASPTPIGSAFTIDATTATVDPIDPKISKAIIDGTDFLIVWERAAGNRNFVSGRMYDRNGNPRTAAFTLYNNAFLGHEAPDCDGDGDTFMAVWQRSEGIASTDFDIVCRSIAWDGSNQSLGTFVQPLEEGVADNETAPSVALTSSNAVVTYLDQDPTGTNVYLKSVDPFTGFATGEIALATGITSSETNVVARSSVSDDVLVVWDDAAAADVFGQLYDGIGESSVIGGGCGVEGRPVIPGALAGNQEFRIHLRGATPGVLAACVTGVSTFAIPCGACTLWPNVEVVYYDTTDANGNASVNIPLPPSYADLTFYSQWVTFVPVGACPLAPIDFTDAVRTTIDGNP